MSLYLKVILGFPSLSLAMSFHEKSSHWIKILSQRRSTFSVYTLLVQTIKNYTTVLRQHSYIQLYDITLITTFTWGQIDIKRRIELWAGNCFYVYKSPFQLGFCDGKIELLLLVKLPAIKLFILILDIFYCNAFSYFRGEM